MTRVPLLLCVPLLAVAAGCDPETDKGRDSADGGGEGSGDDGSDDDGGGEGSGDEGSDPVSAQLEVWSVSSAVDGAEGGTVTLRVAPIDDGQVCIHGCGLTFLVDSEPHHISLEVGETDGTTTWLTGAVPGGLAESGAALAELVDGELVVGQVPLRLRSSGATGDLSPVELDAMRVPEPDRADGWSVFRSTTQALEDLAGGIRLGGLATCCGGVSDDSDIFYDIEEGAVINDDFLSDDFDILGFYTSGDAPAESIGFEDDDNAVIFINSEVFAAGPGDAHYGSITLRRAGQDDALVAVVAQAGGIDAHLVTLDETGAGEAKAIPVALSADELPTRVLDVAPLELSDGSLALGILGLVEVDRGKWRGLWFDGRKAYGFDAIGGASATELAEGTAFVGLVNTGDVRSPIDPSKARFWSFNPELVRDGCVGVVAVHNIGSTVTGLREVKVQDADTSGKCTTFGDVRTVAATELDGDGDGTADLLVQVFGADADGVASHSDHLLPDLDNARAATTSVRLVPALSAPGYAPASLGSWTLDGGDTSQPVAPRPTAQKNGGGWLSLDGIRFPTRHITLNAQPGSWQDVRNVWSETALVAAVADSKAGPVTLGADGGGVVAHNKKKEPPPNNCSGHGVCQPGKCYCVAGYSGSAGKLLGSGAVGGAAGASNLTSGESGYIRTGHRATLHQVAFEDTVGADIVIASSDHGGASVSVVVEASTGRTLWLEDGVEGVVIEGADSVQLFRPEVEDEVVVGLWVGDDLSALSADHNTTRPRILGLVSGAGQGAALRLPERSTQGGTTQPRVLGAPVEGGATLFWRDGRGQAWLAVLDLDAASSASEGEAPLRAGPMAVGGASADVAEMLELHDDRPLAVGFHAGPPVSPLLADSVDARAARYGSVTAVSGVPTGPVVMVTVDLAGAEVGPSPDPESVCTLANITLPVDAIGSEDWGDRAYVERATESNCADLAQPLAAGRFFADGRDGVFRVDGHGVGTVTGLLETDEASTIAADNPIFESSPGAHNNILAKMGGSAGDIDGDGIDEVWVTAWGHPGPLVLGMGDDGLAVWTSAGELDGVDGLGETSPGPLTNMLVTQPMATPLSVVGDLRF